MATRRHKRSSEDVGFQLAPMIDMTFLLLIFFMLTSTITNQQVVRNVVVPVAPSAVPPKDASGRLILNIDADENLIIDQQRIETEALAGLLAERLAANPSLQLYLRADRTVPAKRLKEIVRLATEAGVSRVIIATTRTS